MTVKLKAALPKEDSQLNGLDAIYTHLCSRPKGAHVVVAVVSCDKISTDVDSGVKVPTVRVEHIEVIPPDQASSVRQFLDEAYTQRTGNRPLPSL